MSPSPSSRGAARLTSAAVVSAVAAAALAATPAAAASPDVVISEVYGGGGNRGATYTHDFVELENRGSTAVDVSGWTVQYASATGTSWQRTQLSGTIAPGARYLVQQGRGSGGTTPLPTPDATGTVAMGGTGGKVALVAGSQPCGGAACADPALRDLVGYGADADGFEGSGPAKGASNTASVSRAGADTDDNATDFTAGDPNPGAGGSGGDTGATADCAATPSHEVGQVQGSGDRSPLAGRDVSLRGVVVADLPGLGGFHLQDADGDGDPATSDAVFVSVPAGATVDVTLGDVVAVGGGVSEAFGQTQVAGNALAVCAQGAELPAAAVLDLPADAADRERLEGMLVRSADPLTVSEVYGLTRFGELLLSEGGVLVQPTDVARPGPEAQAVAAANALRRIVLDDASSSRTGITDRPYLSPQTPVRVGDVLTFTEPVVLGFGFGAWRLQPADGTAEGVFAPQNTRPQAPEAVGGDVRIGAFNVLNYFLTRGGVGRGADTEEEFQEQVAKTIPAIRGLGADVVTLMEVEDTASTGYGDGSPDQALADLVARLNAAEGAEVWAYSPMPAELLAEGVRRDVIRNAIIYRRDVVEPVGAPVALVDEEVWSNAREPIAQTFTKDGDAFTVIANHFKSKGGNGTGDNADQRDGQAAWNGDRVRQARSLAGFVERLRAVDPDVVAMGDFNAYTREDPMEVLREAGLTDLGERFDPGHHSYVFDGLSGSLDHALATAELTAKVTDAAHWNINSAESVAYQYSGDPALFAADPYRASDHDPLIFGVDLDERCAGLVPTLRGTAGDDRLTGTNGRDVVMGLGGDDVLDGGNDDDVLCGGAGDDRILGGNGDDVLLGGFGADKLLGGNGDDVLTGGPGADDLLGGRGRNELVQDGAAS
ncbi:hypothetical protein CLV92_11765 [Kineococcus xinjiangensis]|uniref:LTD domain-containing protein n=1 Tax=Kineococcus xinjiangensis TaxID=512762 RepID=A0A2S6ID57_9ACTN|nr:ExeM/NucH family extracellular endonuclease [Kineococcus xinjiangensis]PPK92100.1 hypothetical protein CLV92_11765 [Kineococcus xinjiangensis]